MLNVKKLFTKILESIYATDQNVQTAQTDIQTIQTALTPALQQNVPTAGTNVSLSSYNYIYKMGRLVVATLNFQVTGSISSGATVLSGFPAPIGRWVFPITRSGATQSASLRLNTNGTVVADGAISTTGYYDASFVYITAS